MKIERSKTVNYKDLRSYTSAVFVAVGLPEADARIAANALVLADLRNKSSHGVTRIPVYASRISSGFINPTPNYSVVRRGPIIRIDGNNGLGQVVAFRAAENLIPLVDKYGLGVVSLFNTNHIGMVGYYTEFVAKHGMICLAFANASAHVAPWGGSTPILGTNPISVSIPRQAARPILLDMATTTISRGMILLANKNEERIPNDWAIDENGRSTTDPAEALKGSVLPMAGPKGYGLALVIDILAGVLSGANFNGLVPPMTAESAQELNCGALFIGLKPDNFIDPKEFDNRIDHIVSAIFNSQKRPGFDKIYLPGGPEFEAEQENKIKGISIAEATINQLLSLEAKINLPYEISIRTLVENS